MATITKQGQKGNLTKLDLDYEGTKDGEDQVKNYLEIVQQKLGFIPNVLAAFAKFPKQFEGFTKLYNALMLGESGLTKLEREMIAVTVSSENHCFYCLVAHGSAVRELSKDPQLGERIAANFRSAELPKKQEELLNFTKKLTKDPLVKFVFIFGSTTKLIRSPVGFVISIFKSLRKIFPSVGARRHPFFIFLASNISSTFGKPCTISTVFNLL